MKRAPAIFQEVFDTLALSLNFTAAEVAANAVLQGKLLAVFNRAYAKGYGKRSWEDAWDGAAVTPVSRLIDFASVRDARRFEVWSADPRDPANRAYALGYTTTRNGILLDETVTSAFVLSMPKTPKFTTNAYAGGTTYAADALVLASDGNVYVSLQGGNMGNAPASSPSYWEVVPVLEVLAEFVVAYARGTYKIESSQVEAGAAARKDAADDLEELAMTEFHRLASDAWKPCC